MTLVFVAKNGAFFNSLFKVMNVFVFVFWYCWHFKLQNPISVDFAIIVKILFYEPAWPQLTFMLTAEIDPLVSKYRLLPVPSCFSTFYAKNFSSIIVIAFSFRGLDPNFIITYIGNFELSIWYNRHRQKKKVGIILNKCPDVCFL